MMQEVGVLISTKLVHMESLWSLLQSLKLWFTAYQHNSMLQLVGYGNNLVRNTKLRVLAVRESKCFC